MKYVFVCAGVSLSIYMGALFLPHPSHAQTTEQAQIQALLVLITQLQQQLSALLSQQASCLVLTQNLYIGLNDASTGGQVSKLQKFLKAQGDYTYPTITGFFGAATQNALQKFQARVGLVSGGTPATNGFGVAGSVTRAKIQSLSCGGPAVPTLPQTPAPPVPLPGGVTGSCSPSIATIIQGQSVTWTASVSGGTGSYTYSWSGTNNLSGSASSVTKIYNSEGNKNATVKINSVSIPCSSAVTVNENPALNYNISCSASATEIPVGGSVTYSSTVSDGTPPYTYSWSGTDGLSGSASSVTKTHSTSGLKSASVTINNIDGKDCPDVQVESSVTGTLSWPPTSETVRPIYAFSIVPTGQYENVFSFHWVGAAGGNVPNPVSSAITATINAIASHPEGEKTIRLRNVEDWLFTFKDQNTNTWKDMCLDSSGEPVILNLDVTDVSAANLPQLADANQSLTNRPMQCPWWDEGKNFTQNWLQTFFLGIKNAGKNIDHVITDDEAHIPYGGWSLSITHDRCLQNRENCPMSWCDAMVQDPRWPPEGIPFPDGNEFIQKVCTINGQSSEELWKNIRTYDAWLFGYMADYMDEAIYDVATDYFPDVTYSEYGMLAWDDDYPVPYISIPYYEYGYGGFPGTHQSPFPYGNMWMSEQQMENGGVPNYPANAFNSFRFYSNWVKSAALSDNAHLQPWITDKFFAGSQLTASDLYQEMIIHTGLANTDDFIFWTGSGGASSVPLINNIISELEIMMGYEGVEMVDDDISDWYTDFMYTGVRVGDYNVWRFTPKLSSGQSLSSVIQNSGSSNGTASVVFSVGGDTVTFPNAMIYTPSSPVSQQGVWVIQNASAPDPIVAYAPSPANGQFANAWTAVSRGFESVANAFTNVFLGLVDFVSNLF